MAGQQQTPPLVLGRGLPWCVGCACKALRVDRRRKVGQAPRPAPQKVQAQAFSAPRELSGRRLQRSPELSRWMAKCLHSAPMRSYLPVYRPCSRGAAAACCRRRQTARGHGAVHRPPEPHCVGLKQSALLSLVPSISPSRHQCCLAWPCCRCCAPAACAWAAGSARAALVHGS